MREKEMENVDYNENEMHIILKFLLNHDWPKFVFHFPIFITIFPFMLIKEWEYHLLWFSSNWIDTPKCSFTSSFIPSQMVIWGGQQLTYSIFPDSYTSSKKGNPHSHCHINWSGFVLLVYADYWGESILLRDSCGWRSVHRHS